MKSNNEETDDPEYQRVFSALDEAGFPFLRPFFKEQCLQDDTLCLMESEEELRNFLFKDLRLPFGQGFTFSRHWFKNYHKREEELDSMKSTAAYSVALPKSVAPSENLVADKDVQMKLSISPSTMSGSLKNEEWASTKAPSFGAQLTDESVDLRDSANLTTERQMNNNEGQTRQEEEDVNGSPAELTIVPKDRMHHLDEQVVTNATPGPFLTSCVIQQKPKEFLTNQAKDFADINKMRGELRQCAVKESPTVKNEFQDNDHMGQDSSALQQQQTTIKMDEPQNIREESPTPLLGPETVISTSRKDMRYVVNAVEEKSTQIHFSECKDHDHQVTGLKTIRCEREDKNCNLKTLVEEEGMTDPKLLLEDNHLQKETCSLVHTEDDACVNLKRNQKIVTDSCEVEDCTNGIVSGEDREETVSENSLKTPKMETAVDQRREPASRKDNGSDTVLKYPDNEHQNASCETTDSRWLEPRGEVTVSREVIPARIVSDALPIGETEFLWLAESMTPETYRSDARMPLQGTRRKTNDPNGENSDRCFEDHASWDGKSGIGSIDSDPYHQEDEQKFDCEQTEWKGEVLKKDHINIEINNNYAGSPATKPIATQLESTIVKRSRFEKQISNENGDTGDCTSTAAESSMQRSEPIQESYLSDTDNNRLRDLGQVVCKGSESIDSDLCGQDDEPKIDNEQAGLTGEVLEKDKINLEINEIHAVKIHVAEMGVSAATKPIATQEKSSLEKEEQIGKDISNDDGGEDNCTSNVEVNCIQRCEADEKSYLSETYNNQVQGVTQVVCKGLGSTASDPCGQEDELKIDSNQAGLTREVLGKDQTNLEINNIHAVKIDFAEMAVSAATKPIATQQKSSFEKGAQIGKDISSDDGHEGDCTSTVEGSYIQRGEPEEKSSYEAENNHVQDVRRAVCKCAPRPLGLKGREFRYEKGFVLDTEENREVEFKSLTNADNSSLPWKIMEKAKKFICACLNADSKGIIYFGVGDCQEQCSKFKRGEILGLDVEEVIDDIVKAFQSVLDDHIKSDDGQLQKGGEQNCVNLEFVPVISEGTRTSLYVIEIEVNRDWKFCKDNIYYSKCWTEKRGVRTEMGFPSKKGLSDLYKIHKDKFDDVAVRTNGASTSVQQHDVKRQVKEPLKAKYKEWKRGEKIGAYELLADPPLEDAVVKKVSAMVRNRLQNLNYKDFGYVLIANKMPPKYRGTSHLAFLQNIPWLAVFDLFDTASKEDGLYFVCNETTDAPRAKLRSLDDFKNVSPDWMPGQNFNLPTRGTTWILRNEEMQKGNWFKCSRDCFYRALSAYKLCCPSGRILCVFLGLDESGLQEMVDMMECCFSILGNSTSNWLTIMSESKHVAEAFIKASKPQLQRELTECSIIGIPWRLLREIVREMVGPSKFEERGATTELPYFTGHLKDVLNKIIHSWDDLEVYSPNPRLSSSLEDIEEERNAFYKGGQASQTNLFHNHCIPRTLEEETNTKIKQALKDLSKSSMTMHCHVQTVTVPYEPGSGATTLCRRILWKKRKEIRCAIVKAITPATDYQIEQFQGILYDEKNLEYAPPCLILVDNFHEIETRRLTEKIMKRQIKCVILSTFPIAKLSQISGSDVTPLRQLDENEMRLVKDVLLNITSDSRRRKGAEEVLDREKRFIWFGLELFGRDYDKIEERLQNHIQSTLDFLGDSQNIHETVLNFCCFLHYYSDGRAILPHAVVGDFLYEASNENEECALTEHVHKIFGGLLLEGFNETNGYHGWRPAHSLVSEVVRSRIDTEETAVRLLEVIYKGKAHANKFLKEQVLKVFLDRKRISDPVLVEDQRKDYGRNDSYLENEVFGFYEVKTRYSPFIVDILERDSGIQKALRLLITICQKTAETDDKAYAWQQLARFMGYEMAANEMDRANEQHHRLHTTMNLQQDVKVAMPKIGIEAAHTAVDIAIHLQPNYSHHYVTKGNLYLLQLRSFKPEERPNLACDSMPTVIELCRKALEFYDKALSTTHALNHYSMIGKIQAIVSLLEIVKGLPLFRLDRESFTKYLMKTEIPEQIDSAFTPEEHDYVQSLSITTRDLLNELFGDVKFRQMTTYGDSDIRGLSNAKIRASKLRRTFYEVTGFDRRELRIMDVPMPSSPLPKDHAIYQQFVQDILFKKDETPYSSWARLGDEDVLCIYQLLKGLCQRGYGSHEDMLICCKACLRLKDRPPVEELDETVSKWVSKYPNSEWAHLFNYMIHFPIPNGSLAVFGPSARESIKKCDKIVREKTGIGFRKSAAEYFLGKGRGLYAVASMQSLHQEFPSLENKKGTKTEFWRSKEISEKFERVCGQKDVNFNGVITYKGIQLRFDNTRYPNQSKDDLWFYVGFSVSGPYAFDPVDKDTYDSMRRKTNESVLSKFPPREDATPKDNLDTSLSKKGGKLCELNTTTQDRMPGAVLANEEISDEFPRFSTNTSQMASHPISNSSSTQNFLKMLPSGPEMVGQSPVLALSSISSWKSVDSLPRQLATSKPISYASAVQLGSGGQEESMENPDSRFSSNPVPAKNLRWKPTEGRRGKKKQWFQPKYVDEMGKLHHGALVRGAEKSQECVIHTSPDCDPGTLSRCTFAHSWMGDTLQFVCKRCTKDNKNVCKEKRLHEPNIWNLGPYRNEDGAIWKDISHKQRK